MQPVEQRDNTPAALGRVLADLAQMHQLKDAAYGTSWRRRGELFSIFPNLARKADRLESGVSTPDEQKLDTVADLAVYALKYLGWLWQRSNPQFDRLDDCTVYMQTAASVDTRIRNGEYRLYVTQLDAERLIRSSFDKLDDYLTRLNARGVREHVMKRRLAGDLAAGCILWLCHVAESYGADYSTWAAHWKEQPDVRT